MSLDDVIKFVLGISDVELAKKIGGYWVDLMAHDLMFIPQGWLCAERCYDSQLVYGARKSYLVQSDRAAKNYEASIALLKRSGRNPAKMEDILKLYCS